MSSAKSKKRKGASCDRKITTKNKHVEDQKSDVLVLPPDLLQKLGINLENIQSPQLSLIENNAGACSDSNEFLRTEASELNTANKYIHNDEKETSILETASLMKASVFLSPTFSSLKSNISLYTESNNSEICIEEIISKTSDTIKTDKQNKHFNNKDELKADCLNNINTKINDCKKSICENEIQLANVKSTYKDIDDNIEPVKTSAKGLKEKNEHLKAIQMKSNNTKEEEILEFESIKISKQNNSAHKNALIPTASLTLDTTISLSNKSTERNESSSSNTIEDRSKRHQDTTKNKQCKQKINQDKHDSSAKCSLEEFDSQLNERKTPKVSNVNDRVIKRGKGELDNNSNNCSSHDENVKLRASLEDELNSESIVEKKYGENISVQHDLNTRTIAKKTNGDIYLPTTSECQNDIRNKPIDVMCNEENKSYDSHEELCEAKKIGHENNNLDKGQKDNEVDSNCTENAPCISQKLIDNIDNRSSESKSSLGKVEEMAFYLSQHTQSSMIKNIKTTQSTSISKSCIQGVEKPGGDIKSIHLNRNIKTYSRHRNPKLSNTTSVPLVSYSEYNVGSDIDYNINDINLYSGTEKLHTFCLCDDYGNFFNYDFDNGYGHIHFWERKEIQCSVETLLSIYEESNLTDEKEVNLLSIFEIEDIDEESQQGMPSDSETNICWNYDGNNISKKENQEYNPQKLPNMNDVECVANKNDHIDNAETLLNKGKRKRVDKTSESESESEKLSNKKATTSIKYGGCGSKSNNHNISKAHCLIALRAGKEINDDKAADITQTSEIVIEVPLAHEMLKKEKSEKPVLDIKSEKKQMTELRKRQKTEIKENVEEPLQLGNVEKQLTGKDLWQTENREDQVVEVFQIVTEEEQNIQMPVLQLLETGLNQEAVVQLEGTGENQEAEMPVSFEIGQKQVHEGQKQAPKVLTLQGKTEQKQAVVSVFEIENRQKQVAEVPAVDTKEKYVTCGVCKTIIYDSLWMEHITQEHNYIAWKDGEQPLDYEDEEDIRHYLNNIIKEVGELVCKICGLKRKFAKSYLKHIKNCPIAGQSDDQIVDQATTPVSIKSEEIDSENTRGRRARKERNYKDDTESSEALNVENIKKEKINKIGKDKTRKSDAEIVKKVETENFTVKCGVCKLELSNAQWMEHIFKEHDYLAWQEGEPEIDMNDKQQVYDHLFYITKQNDGLTCKKCGLTRRYVKSYLKHIDICEGETETPNSTVGSDGAMDVSTIDTLILDLSNDEKTKCGVCHMDVEAKQWFNHVHKCHAYLAWKEGKPALDLENEQEIQEYLYFVSKKYNGLICHKCGLNRKYVKAYLTHLESCESKLLDASIVGDGTSNKDSFICAVCSEEVDPKEWNNHAMKMHYNIAWAVGDYPVDVKNASAVEKLLKVYQKQNGSFKCKICGMKRASAMGFYVHIIQCGKTEEEIDQFKVFCELCNSKYLCFYKSQHGIMHREQELSKRRKLMNCEKEETQDSTQEGTEIDSPQTGPLSGRRRAAEKARQFIEKSETFAHKCSKCGYGADDKAELDEHACTKVKYKDYSDSEDSALIESADESLDSAVDSNLSDEEACSERRRKKGHGDLSAATKVPRIPFAVKCAKSYLKQSMDDYRNAFLTNGALYPRWRTCDIELIADDQIAPYLPTLKESCNVIIGRSDPVTYNLFQAKKQNGFSIFVGGCIQAISWAPPHLGDSSDALGHFLAVVCHNNVDAPRLDCAKTYEYSGLIQIWDFGDLSSTYPEFALGIAHDYGTVWAIDWCPSGVRDVFPLEEDNESNSCTFLRLGLLAVACSNGSAYIFSVPYPSIVKFNDKNVYKLTPVAELRLSRGMRRDSCQATSISWSPQNGHGTVMVGYSSGTVALYNLECDSPLLMEKEGAVNIFYPFLDERPHSSCITDVKTFPSSVGAGLMSSVSPTGSETAQMRGFARIHKHLSSTSSAFAPHWPALMVSGNELIVNQAVNELDFWHQGRRTGAVQRCCGCLYCGHMANFAPPVLKILTTHPAYTDFNKEPIAVFQMRPLSKKRPKQKNDELQVKLEPLTYHDAVKLYALDFKLIKDLDKESAKQLNKPREQYPERFPLSDVPSMAFYPSQKHHKKLAVATHAGIIFILTDDVAL
ncbi:uncharacterized protein LOC123869035 [Maniola jurtina]|uniref:uncharacterized protein LOC123869035 n=1 Tax=Maniola jurtina TaxID=191418 RepID=UPI001E686F70|nr:uncharacterized protein LOC123869035 [Maniola jurtina]